MYGIDRAGQIRSAGLDGTRPPPFLSMERRRTPHRSPRRAGRRQAALVGSVLTYSHAHLVVAHWPYRR